MEKVRVETNKRDLKLVMNNIKTELENTDLDVIRKGPGFMDKSRYNAAHSSATRGNLDQFKNILSAQVRNMSPNKNKKKVKPIKRIVT